MTIVGTMGSSEKGKNPVPMTIISHRKEYSPSQGLNQRPPVLPSCTLPTEIHVFRGPDDIMPADGNFCVVYTFLKHVNYLINPFPITPFGDCPKFKEAADEN